MTVYRRAFASVVFVVLSTQAVRADAKKPTYDEDVLPILRQHCNTCHGNEKQRGGLNLAGFAKIMEGGSGGAVVKAGDADGSRLFSLSAHKEEPKMPPNAARIPDAHLEILKLWIDQGLRENAGSKAATAMKPKVDLSLKTASKGKPEGPPPMPQPGALPLDPPHRGRRAGAVLALAASPWAPLVAVGGVKQVLLYNSDTGDLLGALPFEHGQVNAIKFSRNAKLLLVAGGRGGQLGKAVLYDVGTGKKVTEVGTETDALLAADLSADQSMIAVGGPSKLVRVYSTADGSVLHEIKKHTDWVTAVEFSPDGVLLASGDRNGGLFAWEANTGREFHTLRGHTAMIADVSWRPDSNVLASGSEDGTVRLWEMENGRQIKNWAGHGGGVQSVKFSGDGKLASTGRDRVTKYWDGNGALQKQFPPFGDVGLRVAVNHDNTKVFAGDWAGTVSSWTAADGKAFVSLDANPPTFAEQTKLAEAALAAAEEKVTHASAAVKAADEAAGKANAAVAAVQKEATDMATQAKAVTDTITPTKAEVDRQAAASAAVARTVAAQEVFANAFATAAKSVADAAAKDPNNPEFAAVAKHAADVAKKGSDDLAAAKKLAHDTAVALQQANEKFANTQKAAGAKSAAAAEAQKKIAAAQAAAKPAVDAANAAKVAAADAVAARDRAKAKVDRLKANPQAKK